MARTPQEELVHLVSDLYSVELQALAQLKSAPGLVKNPALAADFRTHYGETVQQAERIRGRLEDLGGSSSKIKEGIMKLGGKGFVLFAKAQAETPGRLVAHAYAYEAMEWAGYAMLIRMAELRDDETTAGLARNIQAEEREMMQRLERGFDAAEAVSHRDLSAEKLAHHVRKHLAEVHAFEAQSVKLLEKAADRADDPELQQMYQRHLEETQSQSDSVEQRLKSLGSDRSIFQDAAMKLGGLNWGMFFQAQSDTPAKLAAFAYAFEHLEIAAYELLRRTARRAQDSETEQLCERIIAQERAMADRLANSVDLSVRATLAEVHK